jgi:hypothetical protein
VGDWFGFVCVEEKNGPVGEQLQETGFIDFYGPYRPKVDDSIVKI